MGLCGTLGSEQGDSGASPCSPQDHSSLWSGLLWPAPTADLPARPRIGKCANPRYETGSA